MFQVVSVGVIIAGSLQVDFVDGFTSTFPNFSVSDELKEDNVTTVYPITGITIVGEVCLATGAVGLAWEVTMILLRFLNIGILNLMSRGFLAIVSYILLHNKHYQLANNNNRLIRYISFL